MDIEGAEIEALKGMGKTLQKNKPSLAVASYHIRDRKKTFKKVENILENYSFKTKTPDPPMNRELVTFAKNTNSEMSKNGEG